MLGCVTGKDGETTMEQIYIYAMQHWTEWLFTTLLAVLGVGYRKLAQQFKEERGKNQALQNGMQALLRDRIIQAYNHYQDKGYCPIYAKENVKRMYDAYHALGGNDVATDLKDKLLNMPIDLEPNEI